MHKLLPQTKLDHNKNSLRPEADRPEPKVDFFEQLSLLIKTTSAAPSSKAKQLTNGKVSKDLNSSVKIARDNQSDRAADSVVGLDSQVQKARGEMDVQVEFNERLITEVQMQACLYDCNDIAYKNSIRRNDVWDEIAAALACQVETAKTRWKTLRDRYKKEMKKCRVGIPITWSHYGQMKFLDPYLKDRASSPLANQPPATTERHEASNNNEQTGSWHEDADSFDGEHLESEAVSALLRSTSNSTATSSSLATASPSAPISTPTGNTTGDPRPAQPASSTTRSRKRKSTLSDHLDAVPISQVQAHSTLPSRAEIISTNDEDEIFGHIVAMKLQKMPERMKSIAKMRVLETLIEVQYGKQALQNGTIHDRHE